MLPIPNQRKASLILRVESTIIFVLANWHATSDKTVMCHKDASVSVCVSVGVCVFVPLQYDDISQISFEQFCNFNQLYLYVMARECARTPHVAPPPSHYAPCWTCCWCRCCCCCCLVINLSSLMAASATAHNFMYFMLQMVAKTHTNTNQQQQ